MDLRVHSGCHRLYDRSADRSPSEHELARSAGGSVMATGWDQASEWPRGDILTPIPSCRIVNRLSVRQPGTRHRLGPGAVGLDPRDP